MNIMKADRDLDLNYSGTLVLLADKPEQPVYKVVGTDGMRLILNDAVFGGRNIVVNISSDNVLPTMPDFGLRNYGGCACYLSRRCARQYRRGANLNNLSLTQVHDGRTSNTGQEAILAVELFRPTYPDVGFAVWALIAGKLPSVALDSDVALAYGKNELHVFYRRWCVGKLDPSCMRAEVSVSHERVITALSKYMEVV